MFSFLSTKPPSDSQTLLQPVPSEHPPSIEWECSICCAGRIPNETLVYHSTASSKEKNKPQHIFHETCIHSWLENQERTLSGRCCPICKETLEFPTITDQGSKTQFCQGRALITAVKTHDLSLVQQCLKPTSLDRIKNKLGVSTPKRISDTARGIALITAIEQRDHNLIYTLLDDGPISPMTFEQALMKAFETNDDHLVGTLLKKFENLLSHISEAARGIFAELAARNLESSVIDRITNSGPISESVRLKILAIYIKKGTDHSLAKKILEETAFSAMSKEIRGAIAIHLLRFIGDSHQTAAILASGPIPDCDRSILALNALATASHEAILNANYGRSYCEELTLLQLIFQDGHIPEDRDLHVALDKALCTAVSFQSFNLLNFLLTQTQLQISQELRDNAAENYKGLEFFPCIKLLMANGPISEYLLFCIINEALRVRDLDNEAIRLRDLDVVKYILDKGSISEHSLFMIINRAIEVRDLDVIKYILEKDLISKNGLQAILDEAYRQADFDVIECIIDKIDLPQSHKKLYIDFIKNPDSDKTNLRFAATFLIGAAIGIILHQLLKPRNS